MATTKSKEKNTTDETNQDTSSSFKEPETEVKSLESIHSEEYLNHVHELQNDGNEFMSRIAGIVK